MSTSEPRISDERASASAGLTSLGWLKALRHDLPGSTIPTRTHESGRAVRACLDGKKMWPNVTMTPANKLVSRYFKKYDPFQREYRYATLREAFEYLQPHLPKDVPYLGPVCKPSSEAGVG